MPLNIRQHFASNHIHTVQYIEIHYGSQNCARFTSLCSMNWLHFSHDTFQRFILRSTFSSRLNSCSFLKYCDEHTHTHKHTFVTSSNCELKCAYVLYAKLHAFNFENLICESVYQHIDGISLPIQRKQLFSLSNARRKNMENKYTLIWWA